MVVRGLPIWGNAASSYDPGVTATTSVSVILPNNATPNQTISGVWNIGKTWPNATITAVTNSGGKARLTLSWNTAAPTITVGQYVVGSANTATAFWNSAKVLAVASATDITIDKSYSATTGGKIYGPVPRALLNINSAGVTIENSDIDCRGAAGCTGIANYGVAQSGGREAQINRVTIKGIGAACIASIGIGVTTQISGGSCYQGTYNTLSTRTGVGWLFAGSADSRIHGGAVAAYLNIPLWTDTAANDTNANNVHIYNGLAVAGGGPAYFPTCAEFHGTGSYSGTNDNCVVKIFASTETNYAAPTVQISSNSLPEFFGTGLVPSAVQYICERNTAAGCTITSTAGTPPGIARTAFAQYPIAGSLGGYSIARLVTLVDSDGLYFSKAWTPDSLAAATNLNNATGSSQSLFFNIFGGAAISFAGTSSTSNQQLTSSDLYPTIGASITGTCVPASGKVGFYSPASATLYFAGGATATCSGATTSLTVGTRTITGDLTSGSAVVKNVSFGTIRKGLAVSGTGIPADSWLDGINYYGGAVSFDNAGRTNASASGATTITTAAGSYVFQPDDDRSVFLVTAAKTLRVNPFVPISYSWQVILQNFNTTTTVTPLGGTSTINNSTSATTLTAAYKSVWISSIGTAGSGNARLILSQ